MKKTIFIMLCLISLISGCDNKMDLLKKQINDLTQSTNSAVEKNNAVALNEFSQNNNISYSLDIMKNNKSLNISDLDKNLNETLKIMIKSGDLIQIWVPIDNKNIYILLRE